MSPVALSTTRRHHPSPFRPPKACTNVLDAADAVLVSFREIALGDMLALAEVVALAAVSLDDDNQIAQTIPIGQLSEHHHEQLIPIPASEVFYIVIATVFFNKVIEMVPI